MSSLATDADNLTGIYKFNGTPRTSTPIPTPFIATNTYDNVNKGVSDFAVNPFNTTIYFADSRVPYDSIAGGIQRWDYDSGHGTWVNTYHLTNGLPGDGVANLTVDWSGPSPVIYATTLGTPVTNRNVLVKVADTGAHSPFTVLATSGVKQVYRGLRFGPVQAEPSNPPSNRPGSVPAPIGLINWWPLDGNFNDVVGGNHAVPVAGASIVNGEVGLGCYFDAATNTHLQVGAPPVAPPWTAAFWIYRDNTTWNSASVLGDTNTSLKLEQFKTTRKVGFTDFHVADFSFNYICPPDTWTHLVWVGTSTNTSLYANGVLQDTVVATINMPRGQVGADFGGKIDHTLGVIDEVMLFNRALTQHDIAAMYNAGSAGILRLPEFVTPSPGGNSFIATIRGLTGKNISIYGSADLVNWTLLNAINNNSGTFQFADAFNDSTGLRFYKAIQSP